MCCTDRRIGLGHVAISAASTRSGAGHSRAPPWRAHSVCVKPRPSPSIELTGSPRHSQRGTACQSQQWGCYPLKPHGSHQPRGDGGKGRQCRWGSRIRASCCVVVGRPSGLALCVTSGPG
ncbi:hypothetical protein VTI74DRAFT_6584 [Chaetomium olivicolor]